MRMYVLSAPAPRVFVFEDPDTAWDAVAEIRTALAARGFHAAITDRDCNAVLPPPFEVRRDVVGRTLRGEEYAEYAAACLDIAEFMAPTSVRMSIEEMHVFDWDAFTPAHWAVLEALYPTLPGWLGSESDGVPYWFGRDEEAGPYLWVSVEPPGLQVAAVAEQRAFDEWRARFAEGTRSLPVRSEPL